MRARFFAIIIALFLCFPLQARAGGPAYVAGSGFNPGVKGQPIVWAGNYVEYFTDQGDLSPILTNAQADAFVANAFTSWTSVLDSALTASQGGHLAEDVNGTNVVGYPNGSFSIPADIQPAATATPLGIVYDYDGAVTSALLGAGAGEADFCFTNAVYGGPDNLSSAGNIVHALIVINGVCAASAAQLPDVQYRLMRTLGRVIGLGWSQANLNVITGNPLPTSADYEGFPLMHFKDPVGCVPISSCNPDAATLKMDDTASLVRLYPVTLHQPQKSPAPLVAQQPTARIHGSVYFTDAAGKAVQPMQGVNVVARLLDSMGRASRQYVATSVSGFLFRGNAGNIINGFADGTGLRYDRWGSDDPDLEGYFDLRGLVVPEGQNIALYQLSVEALDANWSAGIEPYNSCYCQVSPSGQFAPVVVTVQPGTNVERDILMLQSAQEGPQPDSGATYAEPAPLPQGGAWPSWVSGYGDAEWFQFAARSNRTASISVTALDESGQPTQSKLMPAIGIWFLSDQSGGPAPASNQSAFNTFNFGMSRLDVQFSASDTFRLGVADSRGDGRPDFPYVASVLYADTATPARVSLAGGVVTLSGIGFNSALQVSAAGKQARILAASSTQIEVVVPPAALDGTATLQVTDPVSGGFSRMVNALTYGAAADDQLLLLQGAETATPVGSQAASPIRVRVVASDGVTPVYGATVAWSTTNGTTLSVCGAGTVCSVFSDQAGESSTWVTPTVVGQSTITATLAPAAYPSPPSAQITLVAIASPLDLAAVTPTKWVGKGATIDVPLTVRALKAGVPQSGVTMNYSLTVGTATLSTASATTNGSGYASVSAHLANHSADVQVSACVAPDNAPCQTFTLHATPASLWALKAISGSEQVVENGKPFQPLIMRVTDGSSSANPVMGVTVAFNTTVARVPPGSRPRTDGDMTVGGTAMPVILGSSSIQAVTDEDGLGSIVPSPGAARGPCDLFITVNAGPAAAQFDLQIVTAAEEDSLRNERVVRRNQAGLQSLIGPGAIWFAVPEVISSPDPPLDSSSNACSDLPDDRNFVAQPCEESKPPVIRVARTLLSAQSRD